MIKIGDKIKIRNKYWYYQNHDDSGRVVCRDLLFVAPMKKFLDQEAIVTGVHTDYNSNGKKFYYYKLNIDQGDWSWTEEMFVSELEEYYDNFTLIPFGEVFIAVDKDNEITIPEFFNNQEDFNNYVKDRRHS